MTRTRRQSGIRTVLLLLLGIFRRDKFGTTVSAACLTTLNELAQLEAAVQNWAAAKRIYTLCPNTRFVVGRLDYSYNLVDGQDSLVVHPNVHVRCGDDGLRSNNCWIMTGDILVKDEVLPTATDTHNLPIVLQGLTFADPGRHFVKLSQPYNVIFEDCAFRQAKRALVPLLLDFYQPMASPETRLKVLWRRCDFDDNMFSSTPANAQPAMIVATNHQVSLSFHGCHFSNNDFITNNTIVDRHSFLIDASGPLELFRNCFSWNSVGVSPAVSYHAADSLVLLENFAEVSRGGVCPFVSHFRTSWQYKTDSPFCYDFDASTCRQDELTVSPTLAPTPPVLTIAPTMVPTVSPSTMAPAKLAKLLPSFAPSTASATITPTRMDSIIVTQSPTLLPTESPTGGGTPESNEPSSDLFTPADAASGATNRALFRMRHHWIVCASSLGSFGIWMLL